MFLSYSEFLLESKNENALEKAKNLIKHNPELLKVLKACVDGEYQKIQISSTQGIKSYVAVATNSGSPESEVFKTSDPKKALLAMIIVNTGQEDPVQLIEMIKVRDVIVEYGVFPGKRKLTMPEMIAKYNFAYNDFNSYLPILAGTPVNKKF